MAVNTHFFHLKTTTLEQWGLFNKEFFLIVIWLGALSGQIFLQQKGAAVKTTIYLRWSEPNAHKKTGPTHWNHILTKRHSRSRCYDVISAVGEYRLSLFFRPHSTETSCPETTWYELRAGSAAASPSENTHGWRQTLWGQLKAARMKCCWGEVEPKQC